jgi:hypothetical protein
MSTPRYHQLGIEEHARTPQYQLGYIPHAEPGRYVLCCCLLMLALLLHDMHTTPSCQLPYVFDALEGVAHGNSRCSFAGCDLNRQWYEPENFVLPEVGAGIGRDCVAAAATAVTKTTPPVAPDHIFTGVLRQESNHTHN